MKSKHYTNNYVKILVYKYNKYGNKWWKGQERHMNNKQLLPDRRSQVSS